MAAIINFSLNLDKLDKAKIIKGKSGTYYDITLSVNDETDQYGYNVKPFNTISREEKDAGVSKHYIGNAKVVWTDGKIVVADKVQKGRPTPKAEPEVIDADFPF